MDNSFSDKLVFREWLESKGVDSLAYAEGRIGRDYPEDGLAGSPAAWIGLPSKVWADTSEGMSLLITDWIVAVVDAERRGIPIEAGMPLVDELAIRLWLEERVSGHGKP